MSHTNNYTVMQEAIVILSSLLAGIALLVLRFWWSRRHIYRLGDQIPGPKAMPLIGNLQHLLGDYLKKMNYFLKDSIAFGNVFRLYFGPYLVVFMSNPNDIQTVSNNLNCYKKNEFFMCGLKSILGEGLITNDGEMWKRHRRIINPTFNYKVLEGFMDTFNENSHTLVKTLGSNANNTTFDVFKIIWLSAFGSVHETILGVSNYENDNYKQIVRVVTRSLEMMMERIQKPWLYFDWVFNRTKLGKEHKDNMITINGIVDRIISLKLQDHRDRNVLKETGEGRSNKFRNLPFLELVITASETEEDLLSPLELRDELLTLAVTGAETTATTSSFALVLLSLYPEHQQQVAEELEAVIGDDPSRAVTTSDLNELKCLDRVIKETLRLYPAAPLNPRNIQEDVKLSSYTLPAGSVAIFNYHALMRDPELYPDPLKFDPDRFLPEAVSQRPSNSFMPFGIGPRICIGYKYSMIQLKIVLAHVLRSYEVLPACTRQDIEDLEVGINIRPVGGHKLRLKPRVKSTVP